MLQMKTKPGALAGGLLALSIVCAAGCGPDAPVDKPKLLPGPTSVVYPVELWDMGIEGETTVMLHVDASGVVDSAYVHETSGFPDFDSAAVRGTLQMRFAPAKRGDERVDAWTRMPIRFQREPADADTPDTGATRERSSRGEP
jgi:TonB family protein